MIKILLITQLMHFFIYLFIYLFIFCPKYNIVEVNDSQTEIN